ncbi:MAG TPA: hypothetical protein PLH24_04365, partial [Candidatus Atribacteria bacterium]|nr:hypothetical protein [Candidatus Atribacteria bacterium]
PSFLNVSIRNLNCFRIKISGFPIEDFGNDRTDNKGAEPPIIPERQKLKIKGKDLKKQKAARIDLMFSLSSVLQSSMSVYHWFKWWAT